MPYAVVVERTVPLSRQRFFAELMDFGGVGKLSPEAVDEVECQGEGLGAVRTVHIKGLPGPVVERLDVASGERVFAYSIINETALPLTRYIAVVELADAPGGGCHVRWGSNWIAKDRPEADVRKMLTQLYNTLIDGIVRVGGVSEHRVSALVAAVLEAGTNAVLRYRDISLAARDDELPEQFLGSFVATSLHEQLQCPVEIERSYTSIASDSGLPSITREIVNEIGRWTADLYVREPEMPPAVIELKILDGAWSRAVGKDLSKLNALARHVSIRGYVAALICETEGQDLQARIDAISASLRRPIDIGRKVEARDGRWHWCFGCIPAGPGRDREVLR